VAHTIISVALMVASWVLIFTHGLNLGVDFVGGQMIRVTFTQSASAPSRNCAARSRRWALASRSSRPLARTTPCRSACACPKVGQEPRRRRGHGQDGDRQGEEGPCRCAHRWRRSVSGKVSGELGTTAIKALGAAAVAISIFIWYRFEWQFGVGALISLIHDVTLVLGLFALTQMEFDLTIVAAMLTVIGYSLNDTIVVYDRIRENLKKYRKMPLPELLDLSVNETLARTVVTSGTMHHAAGAAGAGAQGDLRFLGRADPGHFRLHLFLDLCGRADADLAEGDAEQLCRHRKQAGPSGKAGARTR
jgi:preprotein translocase subunit SecF